MKSGESVKDILRYWWPELVSVALLIYLPPLIDLLIISSLGSTSTLGALGAANNFVHLLRFTYHFPGVTYVQKALGTGPIYSSEITPTAPYYGTLKSYVTLDQLGFPQEEISKPPGGSGRDGLPIYKEAPEIQFITLPELIEKYSTPEDKLLVKMDCA